MQNEPSLTLCPHCNCMTKTMKDGLCGKCKRNKKEVMQNEPQLSAEMEKRFDEEFYGYKSFDHDFEILEKTIRQDERAKVISEVESWLVEVDETNDYERGMNWTVRELHAKLIERKNESN